MFFSRLFTGDSSSCGQRPAGHAPMLAEMSKNESISFVVTQDKVQAAPAFAGQSLICPSGDKNQIASHVPSVRKTEEAFFPGRP
jgi:hypothetical protein